MSDLNEDAVKACADLAGRAGASGCAVEPVRVDAARGDLAAMQAALRQPLNRRDRRRAKRRRR